MTNFLERIKSGEEYIDCSAGRSVFRNEMIAVKDTLVGPNQKLGWSAYAAYYAGPDEVNFVIFKPTVLTNGTYTSRPLNSEDRVTISGVKVNPTKMKDIIMRHAKIEAGEIECREEEERRQKRIKVIQKDLMKEFFA